MWRKCASSSERMKWKGNFTLPRFVNLWSLRRFLRPDQSLAFVSMTWIVVLSLESLTKTFIPKKPYVTSVHQGDCSCYKEGGGLYVLIDIWERVVLVCNYGYKKQDSSFGLGFIKHSTTTVFQRVNLFLDVPKKSQSHCNKLSYTDTKILNISRLWITQHCMEIRVSIKTTGSILD